MRQEKREIVHVTEFLELMRLISSDRRYEETREQVLAETEEEAKVEVYYNLIRENPDASEQEIYEMSISDTK